MILNKTWKEEKILWRIFVKILPAPNIGRLMDVSTKIIAKLSLSLDFQ